MPPSCPCCAFLPQDLFLPAALAVGGDTSATSRVDSSSHGDETSKNPISSAPMSPHEALQRLLLEADEDDDQPVTVVDSHGHTHLERQDDESSSTEEDDIYQVTPSTPTRINLVSLTCAVQESDWQACLDYAGQSTDRMAALGVHPWYLQDLSIHDDGWLQRLERHLQQHAGVAVGEIGLCKMAKCLRTHRDGKAAGLALQRHVFVQQFQLAAQYQRPVSIHCVQQHQVLLDLLREQVTVSNESTSAGSGNATRGRLPPAMAMHSFTGTAHQVEKLLQWEASLFGEDKWGKKKKKQNQKNLNQEEGGAENHCNAAAAAAPRQRPPLIYFGFSHCINHAMCSSEKSQRQGIAAVRAVPYDRLLVESDVHASSQLLGGTVGAVAYVAWALDKPLRDVARQTHANALRFLQKGS